MSCFFAAWEYEKFSIAPTIASVPLSDLRETVCPVSSPSPKGRVAIDELKSECKVTENFRFQTTSNKKFPMFAHCPQSGVVAIFSGRLFGEYLRGAKIPAQVLLDNYLKIGIKCLKDFVGEYSFLIWDPRHPKVIAAKDHLGVRPLFVTRTAKVIAISTEIKFLLGLEGVDKTANESWLIDCFTLSNTDTSQTYYKGVQRIRSAHYLECTRESARLSRYWSLSNAPDVLGLSTDEYVAEYKKRVIQSVQDRIHSAQEVGCELSGGLDSTSVSAVASRLLKSEKKELRTFSHISPERVPAEYFPQDEKGEIKEFCRYSNIRYAFEFQGHCTNSLEALDERIALGSGPTNQTFGLFSTAVYQYAQQEGCDTLLSGFGGDELATGFTPSWRQQYIESGECFKLLAELIRQNKLRPKSALKIMLPQFLFETSLLAKKFWPKRIPKVLFDLSSNLDTSFVDPKKLKKFGKACMGEGWKPWESFKTAREQEEYFFENHGHVPLRLEDEAELGSHYNLHVSYPLLDRRLLEFVIGVPLEQKRQGKNRRLLIRRAMKGYLPDSLRWRDDKGKAAIPGALFQQLRDWRGINISYLEQFPWLEYQKIKSTLPQFFDLRSRKNMSAQPFIRLLIFSRYLEKLRVND